MRLYQSLKRHALWIGRGIAASLVLLASAKALAFDATGVITTYHLNGAAPADRGLCIRTTPTLPGTGWACVYTSNPLYKEITAALTVAYTLGKPVRVYGGSLDRDGHNLIDLVEMNN